MEVIRASRSLKLELALALALALELLTGNNRVPVDGYHPGGQVRHCAQKNITAKKKRVITREMENGTRHRAQWG
jgi:hypothetical protein